MNNSLKNKSPNTNFDKVSEHFFKNTSIPYKKTKNEAWLELEAKLESTIPVENQQLAPRLRMTFAIAASLLVLVAITLVMRFYSVSVNSMPGQHLTAMLPDGSTVELNAASTLSYHPYWWRFSRTVNFEGEGFFKVEKGKKFTVSSQMANTVVLGTSFNIYARNDRYEVTCKTGKVKVISKSRDEGILSPGYQAHIGVEGEVVIYKEKNSDASISWIDNKFIFTAVPLQRVFDEIERQYNVTISRSGEFDFVYTGYFTKDKTPAEVLDLVCKPFGLTYVTTSEAEFEVR